MLCCLCICESTSALLTFECLIQILLNFVTYIVTHEPVSRAHFINPSHQTVCPSCLFLPPLPDKGSVKCSPVSLWRNASINTFTAAMNKINNKRTIRRVFPWVCLCMPLSLLSNNLVKTFPRQRTVVGGVVFYAFSVVSKESRRPKHAA
jgi:hypothetical protein